MRIWLLILLIVSVGFTRAAFAMPAMSADMGMPEMSMLMQEDQAKHHHDSAMPGSKMQEPASKTAQTHCLCVMCFPAIAAVLYRPDGDVSDQMPIPLNAAVRLPSGPEPVFPPPRLG